MSKAVWKFPLVATDKQAVTMPGDPDLLYVAEQNGTICLWARIEPDAPERQRHIRIAGTGHLLEDDSDAIHVGSVMMHGGALVFHIFDCGSNPE